MKYIVLELQTNIDGTVGIITNDYVDGSLAEQRYHSILAAAAVSNIQTHAAVMLTSEGKLLQKQCYHHAVTYVAPVEEPAGEVTEPTE